MILRVWRTLEFAFVGSIVQGMCVEFQEVHVSEAWGSRLRPLFHDA
jgi:hypothetical protein